jgi:hypothetical protein
MRGRVLPYVTDDHASPTNPVVTGGLAVSWRQFISPVRGSDTFSPISFTKAAAATIRQDGQSAGFVKPSLVPRTGVHSRWVAATVYASTPESRPNSPSYKMLNLNYSNFTVQEAASRHAFGSGGDHVESGAVSLKVSGAGIANR